MESTSRETNILANNSRYQIGRYAIDFNAAKTKTQVKHDLARFIGRGDWVILYTHLYNYEDSETLDETSNTIANVLDVVSYANSLCKLRPTESIWGERRILWDVYGK